ncbi:hypothetical protein PR048_005628 [Dryococelus australis]|uniref:DDE Tnp4 domain-containing protein n=1 Tax=Dryococelus australis TaxID=614101 RepID=A0ABQ9I999_9NEOP|nr:hypothetical protein PR048_005628 [Dryococelus australis]
MLNCISPPEMLAVTLRYLATGNISKDLHYIFPIGIKTVRKIVRVLWQISRIVLGQSMASTSESFSHRINVLMAVVDTNYDFIYVNVGAYGKDCSVQDETLNIPSPKSLPDTEEALSSVFVGDEAFALNSNFLCPYGGRELDHVNQVFNYRLTRARRFVECVFGIMSNKWRIFQRPLNISTDFAVDILKACCILQNFIHKEEGLSTTFIDTIIDENSELSTLPRSQAERGSLGTNAIRN